MYNHVVYSLAKSGSNGLTLDIAKDNPQCTMLHSYISLRWHINNNWDRLTVNYHQEDDFGQDELSPKQLEDYDNRKAIKLNALKHFSKNNNYVAFCSTNYIDYHILHFFQNDPRTKIYLIERNIADVFISIYINNYIEWNLTRPVDSVNPKKVFEKNSITIEKFFFDVFATRYRKYIKFRDRISFAKIVKYEDYKFKNSDYYHEWNRDYKLDYIKNKKEVVKFLMQLVQS